MPDLARKMARWTYSQGYPLINVTLDAVTGDAYAQQARHSARCPWPRCSHSPALSLLACV